MQLDLLDTPYKDGLPGSKEKGGASEDAARRVSENANVIRKRVRDYLEGKPDGVTAPQVYEALKRGMPGLTLNSVRSRLSELAKQNKAGHVYAVKAGRRDDPRSEVPLSIYKSLLFAEPPQ